MNYINEIQGNLSALESKNTEFVQFSQNYFSKLPHEQEKLQYAKEGAELLIQKFYDDSDLQNLFKESVNSLPHLKPNLKKEIKLNNMALDKILWRHFTTKGLGKKLTWGWNVIEVSYEDRLESRLNDQEIEKKVDSSPLTVYGTQLMDQGIWKWKYVLTKLTGNYMAFGVMNDKIPLNKFSTQYSDAHCICSDVTSYNMESESGSLSFA